MRHSPTTSAVFPAIGLLYRTLLAVATETRRSGYGLCRVYSYNIEPSWLSTLPPTYRHFFACCSDAGNELNCHEQTLQSPRRREGRLYSEHRVLISSIFRAMPVARGHPPP